MTAKSKILAKNLVKKLAIILAPFEYNFTFIYWKPKDGTWTKEKFLQGEMRLV